MATKRVSKLILFLVLLAAPLVLFGASDTTNVGVTVTSSGAGGGGGGGAGGGSPIPDDEPPIITGMLVVPDLTSAVISWTTNELALSVLSWGTTTDYTSGSIVEQSMAIAHETELVGLASGATYYFKIVVADQNGNQAVYDGLSFSTLVPPDTEPPSNVTNLTAELMEEPDSDSVTLEWVNPPEPDFDAVRVLRNDSFYPSDPFDGEVVYDGPQPETLDITDKGKIYYYTVFTRDESGNYSSGAIIRPVRPGELPTEPSEEFPEAAEPDPEIAELDFSDFEFFQGGESVFEDGAVTIDSEESLTISVDYDKISEVLKAITITLIDPDDPSQKFSFLLRVNKNKTAYLAQIGSLKKPGRYPVRITIFDFKNQGVRQIEGGLFAEVLGPLEPQKEVYERDFFFLFLLFLILYFWYLHIVHRRGY